MEERNNVRNDFLLPIENKQLEKLNHKDGYITSLELLEQINFLGYKMAIKQNYNTRHY